MAEEFLRVENIVKKYGSFTALNGINVSINEGEFVCLLGPSGCGKTTLLRILAGLDKPTSGKVYIRGVDATNMAPAKRNYGIVFQSYALFPNMTVKENIAFGLKNRKVKRSEIEEKVKNALAQVNLSEQINKYPAQLSGGQQQRVAIARAILGEPDLILADEPTGNLDSKSGQEIMDLFKRINKEKGITILQVTHSEKCAEYGDRTIRLENGSVVG